MPENSRPLLPKLYGFQFAVCSLQKIELRHISKQTDIKSSPSGAALGKLYKS